MKEIICNALSSTYTIVYMFLTAIYSGTESAVKPFLSLDSPAWDGLWGAAKVFYYSIILVAGGLFLFYWFSSLVDKSAKGQLSHNELFRAMLELLIGICVIEAGFSLLEGVRTVSGWSMQVASDFSFTMESPEEVSGSTESTIKGILDAEMGNTTTVQNVTYEISNGIVKVTNYKGNILSAFALFFNGTVCILKWFVFGFIAIGCTLIICATAFSRSIQIVIYTCFAPLAFADAYQNGFMNSKALKFVQKYAALCLQAGIILLVCKVCIPVGQVVGLTAFSALGGLGGIGNTLPVLVAMITSVALVLKSQQMSNDLIGV